MLSNSPHAQEFVGGVPKLTSSVFAPFANGSSKSLTLFGTSTKPSGFIKIRLNTLVQGIAIPTASLTSQFPTPVFQAQSQWLQMLPTKDWRPFPFQLPVLVLPRGVGAGQWRRTAGFLLQMSLVEP